MGTELARHLLSEHELTVWNRTSECARPLVYVGATGADTPAAAIWPPEVIITSLFGPHQVPEAVIESQLHP